MGEANAILIPAAILLDNPGITREEFAELLGKTHATNLDVVDGKFNHTSLYGLARILNLDKTRKYKNRKEYRLDKNGLRLFYPSLDVKQRKKKKLWIQPQLNVNCHLENRLEDKVKEDEGFSNYRLEVGDIWRGLFEDDKCALVVDILDELDMRDAHLFDDVGSLIEFRYKLKIRELEIVRRTDSFSSVDELAEKYPKLGPDYMYDFSKEKGILNCGRAGEDAYRWIQENNRYHLDTDYTFRHIPESIRSKRTMPWGYTDLILTAEAIKHEEWRVLESKRNNSLGDFLARWPDSKARYDKAVWDSHMSLFAKQKGLTNSEYLRLRLNPQVVLKDI